MKCKEKSPYKHICGTYENVGKCKACAWIWRPVPYNPLDYVHPKKTDAEKLKVSK
jgi:hypothetical protein